MMLQILKNMKKNLSYIDSVHRDGRIWNLSVMVLLLAFPVAVAIFFNVMPDWAALLSGLIATAPLYWVVGVIETITFVPMLGAGGSYLSFVTGNISNLKLPCALNALEQNEVSASSEEGEVISTIAIATSSIVTTIIIVIGVICIVPLTPILEAPVLVPAFEQMLPALFGGLGVLVCLLCFSGLWDAVDFDECPKPFRGAPIMLITAGLMALSLVGFYGLHIS